MSTSDTKKLLALVSAMNDLSDNMNVNDAKLAVYLKNVTAEGAETGEGSRYFIKKRPVTLENGIQVWKFVARETE